MKTRITITIDVKLLDLVRQLAVDDGRSVSGWINQIIKTNPMIKALERRKDEPIR